jgi:hypothetical protein
MPLPPRARQQGSALPPQATHRLFCATVNGAVQPTLLPQTGCPTPPQAAVPTQLLDWQVLCCRPVQTLPAETQTRWSQQPPPLQVLSAQQAWPAPPQVWQVLLPWASRAQARPPAVQKSGPLLPAQQACPWAPQVLPPPLTQLDAVQVPTWLPQVAPEARHTLFTQQPALQAELAQHAWPAAPNAVKVPFWQTVPALPACPDGMQVWLVAS